jgi:hypothetical protein
MQSDTLRERGQVSLSVALFSLLLVSYPLVENDQNHPRGTNERADNLASRDSVGNRKIPIRAKDCQELGGDCKEVEREL